MDPLIRPIVLMGFKQVGKSSIGLALAKKLNLEFIDLDQKIESLYSDQFAEKLNCRQIMQNKGQNFFHTLESAALYQVLLGNLAIISLGGGTAMQLANQKMLEAALCIHITAPAEVVFGRIQKGGLPAFFDPDEDLRVSFDQFWKERIAVYDRLCKVSVLNEGLVQEAVEKIIVELHS